MSRLERRTKVLFAHGASIAETEMLLAYTEMPDYGRITMPAHIPLPAEPHLSMWNQMAIDAEKKGTHPVLQERFVQLQFPIREGISASNEYQAATRHGDFPALNGEANGLQLEHPDRLQLCIHQSLAGPVPVLLPCGRHDFIALIQAFARKNEPEPIPDAMGAGIIAGYINWYRLHQLRQEWEAGREPDAFVEATWQSELRHHILPYKQLYQDTFIILSDGRYSGIAADDLGLSTETWSQISLTIRLEHECTHYLMRRLLSSMRNHLTDEIIADMRGLVVASGRFRADWFLRFMGLEAFPQYRDGGRLELYRGSPPLSDEAFCILQTLTYNAAVNLEAYTSQDAARWSSDKAQVQLVCALACLTLEELAAPDSHIYIEQALTAIPLTP